MEQYFIISAVGRNITGIVAAVSEQIYLCGCNLEDSRMTLLGNHFTLMILVAGEGEGIGETLKASCRKLRDEKDLSVTLFEVEGRGEETSEPTEPNYEIRVSGIDRAGIVYRTSQLLASFDVNIIDLETSIDPVPEGAPPLFTMKTKVALPKGVDGESLRHDLERLAEDLNEMITLTRIPKA